MQKSSKRVHWENVFARWIVILPEDWGELLFCLNWIICKLFFTHSSSSVSENVITMNRSSTGMTLSPFLNYTSKDMYISIFPSISITLLSVYILLTEEHNFGGRPYFFNTSTISLWFEVSNALTRSANMTNVGKL